MNDENALVPLAVESVAADLPGPSSILTENDAKRTRKAIVKHGVVTSDAKLAYERDGIPAILGTDVPGANKFIAELPDEDLIRDGNKLYIRQPPINKELSRRIQEPRDAYQLERLRDSEKCINAVRDSPSLENRRVKQEALARKEMPRIKRQIIKNSDYCISGEPLQEDAEVHHVERVADNPDLALNIGNMKAANPHIHDQIHAARAHSPKALSELAEENGWPVFTNSEPDEDFRSE